jgi:type VII secretion integral membrane protein EccD
MIGSIFSVTVVGARRRLDVSLPADVPVGELAGELVGMLDEPVEGALPRWGLVRLGGDVLDPERGLAAQGVPSGSLLFLHDLGVALPPLALDDYASEVAAVVEVSPGRWTPIGLQAMFTAAAIAWVLGAGALAAVWLLTGLADETPVFLGSAMVVAVVAVALGRVFGYALSGVALALSALPLWAASGVGLGLLAGLDVPSCVAAGLAAVAVGGLTSAVAAGEGMVPAVALTGALVPGALTLAVCVALGQPLAAGAAVLAPVALTALRLLPRLVVRLTRLDAEPAADSVRARTTGARALVGAMTAGTAVTLAAACVVLATQPGWWARALAITAALAALLHARRRRFVLEVVPLTLVALATVAAFELLWVTGPGARSAASERLTALLATAGALLALGLVGRRRRLPVGVRRQLERLEALTATATFPVALGLLGLYDAAARFAGRLGS